MKIKFQYIFIIAFSAAGISGFAQVTGTRNYVSTNIVKAPGTNTQAQVNALTATGKQSVITYFDGLGRPLQQVAVQQSPAQKDVITPVSYDGYGREIKKYLPYTDNAGTAYGSLHTAAYTEQSAFYSPSTSMPDVARDGNPYAQSFLEFSPSGRMIEQGAEGVTWQPGSGKTVQPLQSVNTAAEQVRRWTITGTTNAVLPTTGATYGNGELLKAVMKDENGKTTITYTDKERKTILKKVQLSASPGITHTGWLCTYYIYDDLNNLRFVLQPKAVELIDPSWVLDADIAYGLCFQYTYDKKGRMITKKMPDADPVYMVYDIRDRLVMTQDGKQRATSPQTWLVTLYDGLNRPVQTGHINTNYSKLSGKTLDQILEDAADQVDYPFALTTPPSGSQYTLFTQTGYDDYDGMSAAGSPLTKDFDNTYNNSTYLHTTYNTSPLYAQQLAQSFQTRGLTTWTKVKIAGVNYFEYTVNIYDDKERIIQTKRRNYTGGTSITTTQYNWVGQPLRIVQKHTKTLNTVHNSIVITDLSYDHAGRVTEMKKKIRNNLVNSNQLPAEWTVIASNQYNAIGQLIAKDLGKKRNTDGTYSAAPLAKLGYGYNIRGWLLSINKPYMGNPNADQYFAMELGYDKDPSMGSFTGKQYNGNISSMLWKSEGDQQRRKYNFTYDATNRLTAADFGQWVSGSGSAATFNTSANVNYSVSGIQYDANGNLTAMKQHGLKLNASVPVDDLLYEVKSKSNRLRWVKDQGIPAGDNGKLGDFKDGANADNTDDYSYNPNGSITMDKNRDISSIAYYATIELPNVITTPKGTIEYVYDVLGNKSWKKTTDNSISGKSISTSTKYLEGFVYESRTTTPADAADPDYADKLQFTAHEEGRIRALYNNASTPNTPTGFAYDYFIKDHLGNVRMV
ncbi:MAG: hypothetical protein KF746_28360, partial [Chitinophagaceae bacterium]|nr:hypothetical protein [Chitinophagaceae bacterium]